MTCSCTAGTALDDLSDIVVYGYTQSISIPMRYTVGTLIDC